MADTNLTLLSSSTATVSPKHSDPADYPVPVLIQTPNGQSVELSFVPSDTIAAILATILDQPRFVHYTCSYLAYNQTRLSEFDSLASILTDNPSDKLTLELVQQPYGERDLRAHVLRTREVIALNNPMRSNPSPTGAVDSGVTIFRHVSGDRYLADPTFDKDVAKHAEKPDFLVETVFDSVNDRTGDHTGAYLSDLVSQKYVKTRKLAKGIISLAISGWNPVPAWRKSRGDLLYLTVIFNTSANEACHITGSRHGFFVNKSTDTTFDPSRKSNVFHSLVKLFSSVSPIFSRFFGKLIESLGRDNAPIVAVERAPIQSVIPATNWCVAMETPGSDRAPYALGTGNTDHTFDSLRQLGGTCAGGDTALETGALDQMRSWNDELQMLMAHALSGLTGEDDADESHDDPADGLNPMLRVRQYNMSYHQFVLLVMQGARGIIDGSILPLPLPGPPVSSTQRSLNLYESAPPSDSIFIWNGIFFSFAEANQPRFAKEGHVDPVSAAHAYTGKDVLGLRNVLSAGIAGLSTIPTVVIDIHGRRICAQAMPPGILDSPTGPNIIYGSQEEPVDPMDPNSVPEFRGVNSDSDFHQIVGKLAEKLFLAEHTVMDEKSGDEHVLWTSPDTRGILALDGRKYLIELPRVSPVDTKFLQSADSDGFAAYPHRLAFVRPEYIKLFNHQIRDKHVATVQRQVYDRQVAEGADPADVRVELDLSEMKDDIPYVRVNVDIGTTWQTDKMVVSETQGQLIDSLYSEAVPQFVRQYVSNLETIPVTSDVLTRSMHACGLSMHHLKATVDEVDDLLGNPDKLTEYAEIMATEDEALAGGKDVGDKVERNEKEEPEKNLIQDGKKESESNVGIKKAAAKCMIGAMQTTHRVRLVALRVVLVREMVLRAFKHIGRKYFASSMPDEITVTASALLNSFLRIVEFSEPQEIELPSNVMELTSELLASALVREVQLRFRFAIAPGSSMESIAHKQALLRESCVILGIQLVMRGYGPEYQIQEYDILTVVPKIKAAYLESEIVLEHVALAEKLMSSHSLIGNAANTLEMALHLSEQAYTSLHPVTIRIQSLLASTYRRLVSETNISEAEAKFALERSLDLMRTTTACRERVFGIDASDVCESYLELANLESLVGRYRLALKYLHHASQLWLSQQGRIDQNPDFTSVTNLVAKFHSRVNRYDLASQYQEEIFKYNAREFGKSAPSTITAMNLLSQYLFMAARTKQSAQMHASEKKKKNGGGLAQFTLDVGAYNQVLCAVELQEQVVEFWSGILLPEDIRLREAVALLGHYKGYQSDLDIASEQHKLAVQQGLLKKMREKEERKNLATKGNCPIDDILAYINGEKKTLVPTAKPSPPRSGVKSANSKKPAVAAKKHGPPAVQKSIKV